MIRPSVILAALSLPLSAAEIRVSWQPNPETDISGYRLQWSAPNPAL